MRETKNTNWSKFRKWINEIHLWLGLISGIIVFIICISGTIYVYNTEIREISLSEYYFVKPQGDKVSISDIVSSVQSQFEADIKGVLIPASEKRAMAVMYDFTDIGNSTQIPAKKTNKRRPSFKRMMIDPYTGQFLGEISSVENGATRFMQKMFSLHRWLLLNEIEKPVINGIENRKLGSWVTGWATILFTLGVISGIVIWFPKKIRSWKNGLKIKWSANWKRLNHDLHNTLGFYTCIILFVMGITGPFWSFEAYREKWQKTWGTYVLPKGEAPAKSTSILPKETSVRMDITQIVNITQRELPYRGDLQITFPSDSTGVITVQKSKVGFFAPAAGDKLEMDQYSGRIIEKDIFADKPISERIGRSIKALHIGSVYGQFTKLLYFISCLVTTSLPVTGILIWLNKRKKRKKPKRKPEIIDYHKVPAI